MELSTFRKYWWHVTLYVTTSGTGLKLYKVA